MTNTLNLIGAVDAIHAPFNLSGWVATRENICERFTVEALINDNVIASTLNDLTRIDTGQNGFSLRMPFEITAERILSGDITFRAVTDDGRSYTLLCYTEFLATCEVEVLIRKLNALSEDRRRSLLSRFDQRMPGPLNQGVLIGEIAKISSFELPVGLVSPDGTAVVGHNGELFLLEGSNKLRSQYTIAPSEIQPTVDKWIHCIRNRESHCHAHGIKFVQTIIPEKTSVWRRHFPVDLPKSTTMMELVDSTAQNEIQSYLSLRDSIEIGRPRSYRRLDTHLTPFGAARVAVKIISKLGYDISEVLNYFEDGNIESRFFSGDLGVKFAEFVEVLNFPKTRSAAQIKSKQESGRQTGTTVVWSNDSPIIDASVVVFGNSFFGTGESEEGISYWFAHAFREFHFIWSGEADWDYVSRLKPDIVVCQTIERFMAGTPSI